MDAADDMKPFAVLMDKIGVLGLETLFKKTLQQMTFADSMSRKTSLREVSRLER